MNSYIIEQLELGPMQNFIYFIKDKSSEDLAVVDPAWEPDAIFQKIDSLGGKLKYILLTHNHNDHINAIEDMLDKYDVAIHLLKRENQFLPLKKHLPTTLHYGGDKLMLGKSQINFLHTPGHTPGSVCYHLENDLITGDTLFVFGCGNCNWGGNPHQLFSSLQKLKTLPADTCIHPGHNYALKKTSLIEEQIQGNPYLQIEQREKFVDYRTHIKRKTPYKAEILEQ